MGSQNKSKQKIWKKKILRIFNFDKILIKSKPFLSRS